VLVISHDTFNERSGTVIALAITSRPQKVALPLALKLETPRLPKPSWVKISQVRLLSATRLGRRLGRVSAEEMEQVIEGLFELVA
jgi:mRNA interferase MazF